jgi:pilus assembly protein CpaB
VKNTIALLIAVVLGIVAIFGVVQYVNKQKDTYERQYKPMRVACASKGIMAGTEITDDHLSKVGKEISEESVMAGNHVRHVNRRSQLVGKRVTRNISAGEPILLSYTQQTVRTMDDLLLPGHRAVAISVDAITGVAGAVAPGNYVDILGTFSLSESGEPVSGGAVAGRTVLILNSVKVIAAGSRTREAQYVMGGRRKSNYNTVTLALTPEEALLITHARKIGDLTLVLRSLADASVIDQSAAGASIDAKGLLDTARRLNAARLHRIKAASSSRPRKRRTGAE